MLVSHEKLYLRHLPYPIICTLFDYNNNTLLHASFLQKHKAIKRAKYGLSMPKNICTLNGELWRAFLVRI